MRMLIVLLIVVGFASCVVKPVIVVDKGASLIQEKKFREAIAFYDSLIKLSPDKSELYSGRARAYYLVYNTDKALEDSEKAIELNSDNFFAFFTKGMVYLNTDREKESFTFFNRAIDLKEDYAEAFCFRGLAYAHLGKMDLALQDLDKAISLNDNLADAFYNRGVIKDRLNKYKEALEDYNRTIEIEKTYASAYYNRGTIRGKIQKNFEGAIEDFNNALMIEPNDVRTLINLALAYGFSGDVQNAHKSLKRAVEIDPTNEKAQGMLYQLEQEMGKQ